MTIRLTKDLEQIVHDAMRSGLYAREDDVIRDALIRLNQAMPIPTKAPAKKVKSTKSAPQKKQPLSPDELIQRLLASGLLSRLPDPAQDIDDDDDPPITIKGEPLSETIIRERR
jgi:Arc/MetJ-type ribon-helix-helix transcriptional regulator